MQQGVEVGKRWPEMKSGVRGDRPVAPPRGPDKIVYSTDRHVLNLPARDDRPTNPDRERADILSVALAQPHRRGNDDPKLSTALGRFCAAHEPRLGIHCWLAGIRYAEIVREAKKAQGFYVHGWSPKEGGGELSEEELEARKDLALIRLREGQSVLRTIMPRLPSAMERLVYDELEPSPYDRGVLVAGLVNLALEWGYLKQRFGAEA
jgi:hypothetical protein